MKKIETAGGVVVRGEGGKTKIALIKDCYGRWAFPKGHVEKGETREQAALREVREEIGCAHLKIIKYLGGTDYWSREGGDERKRKIAHYYLMQSAGGEECVPQIEEGITEVKWFTPDEALQKMDYKNNIPILKRAAREIKANKSKIG